MRYFLIAGEASGDLHGANLMRGLIKSDPHAEFRFWGGDCMAEVGGKASLVRHYKTASFLGFIEVAANLRTVLSQIRECKAEIAAYRPDVLILIDYPGFNFRMARFAHDSGIRTFYYISPKVWAWKESRIKRIKKYVDRLFIIFPFEVGVFQASRHRGRFLRQSARRCRRAAHGLLADRRGVPQSQLFGPETHNRASGWQPPQRNRV